MRFRPPLRLSAIRRFIESETAGGLVLMGAAALALIVANTGLADGYQRLLAAHIGEMSVLHFINDALMALFFLIVGLEIKRELIAGELSTWPKRALPGIAALGGMLVPALIYVAFNLGPSGALSGWAIPAATDIAFSLGVLALLGSRVPVSLKVFLTALAIIDDLGAVIIIAIFYAGALSMPMLALAALTMIVLAGLNYAGVKLLPVYLILGAALWYFVWQSGVHATIAGVLLAATIPITDREGKRSNKAPLAALEHGLHIWVAFGVLPLFGFANAGVSLAGLGDSLLHPVSLGIALGLFVGKQVGVFGGMVVSVATGWTKLPEGATRTQIYGIALLCGIGFTMSLFIGLLAFPASHDLEEAVKVGILEGSLVSAIAGFLVLRFARPSAPARE
jgi:NhaA family Na+:H+ antiporter